MRRLKPSTVSSKPCDRDSKLLTVLFSPSMKWLVLIMVPVFVITFALINTASADGPQPLAFSPATPYNVGSGPYWTATFNRFGKPAIAVTNQTSNSVSVLYGNYVNGQYNGTFSAATTYNLITALAPSPAPQQVLAVNLGQVPIPSLVIAAAGANKVGVLLGNSDDSFPSSPIYYNVGNFPQAIASGDLNGDGNEDIIAANFGSNTVSVLLGNSDRTFQTQQTFTVSSGPESIVCADFNSDGKLDIATSNSGNTPGRVNVLMGNGNGTLQTAVTYLVGTAPYNLAVADFNSDGKQDIVTSNHGATTVSVLINSGNGTFPSTGTTYFAGTAPYSVAVADINIDGQPDIVVANSDNGGSVGILPNSAGVFQPLVAANTFSIGSAPYFVATGDFNLDGKPDVVAPNHPSPVVNPGTINVRLNATPPPVVTPPNDNFVNAQNLNPTGAFSGRVTGTNVGATQETNEPSHAGSSGTKSIWYRWTAPANGAVTFDTFGSAFDTVLAVYTGSSVGALTLRGSNDDDQGLAGDVRNASRVSITAIAGTTYQIAVDGKSGSNVIPSGNVTVNWHMLPPPRNDAFSNAEVITGSSGVVAATNAGATKQVGEPNHAGNVGGGSIWYRWVPPVAGTVTIKTSNPLDTLLAVYTGSLGNLVLIDENDDDNAIPIFSKVSFTADPTKTYFIAVDGKNGTTNNFNLDWGIGSVPNKSFDQALQLGTVSGSVVVPDASGLWYTWATASDGVFFFSVGSFRSPTNSLSHRPSTLTIYTGSSPSTLNTIGTNTGECFGFGQVTCEAARVNFNAEAGVTYRILVTSADLSAVGPWPSLTWGTSSSPPFSSPLNDNFVNAATLNGFGGSLSATLRGATFEPNEPNHSSQQGGSGGTSVWLKWIPQQNVFVTFNSTSFCAGGVISEGITATSIGVYTGEFSNLVEVRKGIGSCSFLGNSTPARVSFSAIQGTIYHISIDRVYSTSPNYSLSWSTDSTPANDNFSNSQTIIGESGHIEGYTNSASSEPNEPSHGFGFAPRSVWYSWTPSTSGLVTVNLSTSSSSGNRLVVYTGNSLSTLSPVIVGQIKFYAVANSTYRVAVVSPSSGGPFTLKWGIPAHIQGRITDLRGIGIENISVTLSGTTSGTRTTDSQGNYAFTDLIQGGDYTVSPSVSSYRYVVNQLSFNPLPAGISTADFVAKTPTYSIEGRLEANGVGVDNVSVNLVGTGIPPGTSVQTTTGGFYAFTDLVVKGDFTVTPTSSLFSFNTTIIPSEHSYTFRTLNNSVKNANFLALPTQKTLTVGSQNPNSGVNIDISPIDKSGLSNGATPLTRVYDATTVVSLSASTTAGTNTFQKWQRDGIDFAVTPNTTVTMDANYTMTAVYVPNTVSISLQTNPAGLSVSIDGGPPVTNPVPVQWIPGSQHTIATTSPQAGTQGTQYVFSNWSDGGAISHTVTTPAITTTYTANLTTQFQLTMSAGSGGTVQPASGFFNSGQSVQISATPNSGFSFSRWTGTGSGSVPNSTNPTATITMNGPITQTAAFVVANTIQFSSATVSANEGASKIDVTFSRGDASGAASVDYSTSDTSGANDCNTNNGAASSRCDYLTTLGTLQFAVGEASKTISIPLVDDVYVEGNETFTITLSGPVGATLGTPASTTLTIVDNDSSPGAGHPIDSAPFFVRQHYIDFLNREPDPSGFNFWTNEITSCGADAKCIEVKRINVSAAFFLSIEFQNTGYLVYRIYKSSFGNLATPPGAPVPVRLAEFLRDTQKIGQGVVVGADDWENQLEANKQAFTLAFVQRADFLAAYPNTMTASEFVDKLNLNASGVLSASERTDLITLLVATPANVNSRSAAVRAVAENTQLKAAETNKAFVLMQYFGYLRRSPNDAPDPDFSGLNFWLDKLNSFSGSFVNAEMVKSFLVSGEYRHRFAP